VQFLKEFFGVSENKLVRRIPDGIGGVHHENKLVRRIPDGIGGVHHENKLVRRIPDGICLPVLVERSGLAYGGIDNDAEALRSALDAQYFAEPSRARI